MPQIFHHSTNALAKATIFGAVFILLAALWVGAQITRSSWNTGQWVERQQPIQFTNITSAMTALIAAIATLRLRPPLPRGCRPLRFA
jgi:hypothetical protein